MKEIRFALSRSGVTPLDGYLVDSASLSTFVTFKVPQELEFLKTFEDANFKGVLYKPKDMANANDGMIMS